MNIFDLPGPDFLKLYLILAAVLIPLSWLLTRWLAQGRRDPAAQTNDPTQLHAYELAFLSGDDTGAVCAGIAALKKNGVVSGTTQIASLEVVDGAIPDDAHPLEQDLVRCLGTLHVRTLNGLVIGARRSLGPIERSLIQAGLLRTQGQRAKIAALGMLPAASLAAVGAVKIFVGVARGRPVLFLFALVALTVFAIVKLGRVPATTAAAQDMLEGLRKKYATLRTTASRDDASLAGHEVALAVGVFGTAGIGSYQLYDQSLARQRARSDNGCGTSCGGGGGCGGGCGGGGCGGCGD